MPSSIATYVHRPKRPPRKKAMAASIAAPVVVKTTTKPRGQRSVAWVDDGQETSPEVKPLVAHMMQPHGT
jgi:hypothetical protein